MKKPVKNLLFIIILVMAGCSDETNDGEILIVTGAIPASQMGISLIHEHVLVDFIGADKTGNLRWDKEEVVSKVLPYLIEAKSLGLSTLLECTPAYLGRDVQILKTLSEKSGVKILTNTGFYGAVQDKFIPQFAYNISADSIAAIWIREFEVGIERTGIRPGFIKIGVDTNSTLSEMDEKLVRAAIITHRKTGLTIVSHTGPDKSAFAQLNLLEQEGISAQCWVWTHAGAGSGEGRIKAAGQGAWISIDNINRNNLDITIKQIVELKSEGYLSRLLISHDAGWYDPDEPGGGNFRGYTDIFDFLLPELKRNGFSQSEIDQLLKENPQNAFMILRRTK